MARSPTFSVSVTWFGEFCDPAGPIGALFTLGTSQTHLGTSNPTKKKRKKKSNTNYHAAKSTITCSSTYIGNTKTWKAFHCSINQNRYPEIKPWQWTISAFRWWISRYFNPKCRSFEFPATTDELSPPALVHPACFPWDSQDTHDSRQHGWKIHYGWFNDVLIQNFIRFIIDIDTYRYL